MAIVGCELWGSGGAGLLVRGGGRAVLNDSYVYWNGGPGVRVEPLAVMSLEHNDCSHNKGGPMQSDGVVRVRLLAFFFLLMRPLSPNNCAYNCHTSNR